MAHTNIYDPLHVYSIRELPLTQLPVDNTIDTLQLVMVISTVQMLHEILQLFYIINCILIRPNKQIAAICKSSFSAFKNSPLFLSDGV